MRRRIPRLFLILVAMTFTACRSGETRCPGETTLAGAKPPAGSEEWCEYKDAEGKSVKHGSYVAWYDDQHKQAEVLYEHGKEHGLTTVWYPSGKKMLEGNYKGGERDGRWTRWYESGTKELETEFAADKKNGRDLRWDEKGTLVADLEWKAGELVKTNVGPPPPPAGALPKAGS